MKGNLMLLLTALIWGTAFVAQSTGMDHVGPFTYNGVRNLIAGFVLFPVIAAFDRMKRNGTVSYAENGINSENNEGSAYRTIDHTSRRNGIFCGVFLFIASSFQQYGISMTTAGKAGFVTALYIVIVPVLGIFLKKRVPPVVWLSAIIAIGGFWLLCIKEGFSVGHGDLLVLCCAFFFSLHILVIDHFNEGPVDGVRMSQAQFFTVAVLSLPFILLTELPGGSASWNVFLSSVLNARWSILYTAIMSSGVAYTLQILAQRYTEPATATLLMSLESVFAALAGWVILHERLSPKELAGCLLVFTAVLLAQMPGADASRE
ncbi:MAG: DMT family transporter [Lachnospiraceae bacterium]|nr:DMT family transporter [Lachnospiraceae bacterium]